MSIKTSSNLQLWSGCWVSSGLHHSRFVMGCSFHSLWFCPHRNLLMCPCTSGLTPLSSDSAPLYCCLVYRKFTKRKYEQGYAWLLRTEEIYWRLCVWRLYWPRKAVSSSKHPTWWHQWPSTCMLAMLLQADLPGPVLNASSFPPDDAVLAAHYPTVWQK